MSAETVDGVAGSRELRLAVVLYGGVSLAIYMHGTTKELHRLVKASALAEAGSETPRTPSEDVYFDLLDELGERDPHKARTRVVVDVIAGTSAGGINGVYLAKALAHNRSQDALRDLWLNRGDIARLLRGPARVPMALKVPVLLAQAVKKPPLKGDAIARWMYGALRDMDADARKPGDLETLLSPRSVLELFVTTTDFAGYQRDLMIADPKLIHDHTHRHVFTFRYGDGEDDFRAADNVGLALAARSTMSFPGAFPPVSLRSFAQALAPEGVDEAALRDRLFRVYELSTADPGRTHFIDGGVLDNRPFGRAIEAIKRRAAESEVDRRLLYLEPDPGQPEAPSPGPERAPSPLATVLAAISGIPRKEPILDDILGVLRHNERVRRIRDIIEMTFAPIAARVEQRIGTDLGRLAQTPSAAELAEWGSRISSDAEEAAGFAYAPYIRSKVSGVVDRYARTICRLSGYPEDCNQAAFVRAVLREWARTRLFTERDGRPVPTEDQVAFLRTFDLDYGARRLRFLIDALSWWYRDVGKPDYPTRAQLDDGKRALYELRDVLLDAIEGRGIGTDLTDEMLAVFARQPIDEWVYRRKLGPSAYAEERAEALAQLETAFGRALDTALEGFGLRVFERVHALTEDWSVERRADLLVRYLGFPFWDTLLYPIQSVADAGERDAIDVVRMSPLDSTLLAPLDPAKPKLDGVRIMHFGAFFDQAGRENDYLWGRLDGAERLIGLLLGADRSVEEHERWCRRAFGAIVEEEESALPAAVALLEHARRFAAA
ncbi:MAG: patatin-like protein [Actinomycetota bacterium]|nr:patatin-like protein [Actinomycetota bacterium]